VLEIGSKPDYDDPEAVDSARDRDNLRFRRSCERMFSSAPLFEKGKAFK